MSKLKDHESRYQLANELHARPFPEIPGPGLALFFAASLDQGATGARADLLALLDRHGADHPAPGANHYYGTLGRDRLKWELHSEFVTYTLFTDAGDKGGFALGFGAGFPEAWQNVVSGRVITSARVLIQRDADAAAVESRMATDIRPLFVQESFAAAYVLDRNAVIAGDFRIDASGHMRFLVIGLGDISARRMGRIVQRVLEVETYKAMSMLTYPVARAVFSDGNALDARLSEIARNMTDSTAEARQTLDRLLAVSAEVELLSSDASYRLSAGRAYRALVAQRIRVMREERILGAQLFSEFMMRRFDPAMRTCEAAEKRLEDLSLRAARASRLLSTRVGVLAAEQNRQLLESMNRRAALQMRLQETVEGLSVVAVSYYAVNLLSYLLGPLVKHWVHSKSLLSGLLVLPVMLVVWLLIRRIKARVGKG